MADDLQGSLSKLESTFENWFKKFPSLPDNVKEIIVGLAPWLTLVGIIIALPAVFLLIGLGALVAPLSFLGGPAAGVSYGASYTVSIVVLAVALVLQAMAIPGLFSRSKKAWRLVYWATLVSAVSSLISFNIVGAVLGLVIGLYFLFQIKSYYK